MRIGIFGGTFDPIHNGHLLSAKEIKNALNFDKILFMPTGEPPHKVARRVTPAKDRLAMVCLATKGLPGFEVSDIECTRPRYSYTYDTLKILTEQSNPDDEFYMIIGADTLQDIFNWYKSEDVFKLCYFVAMKRPGSDDEAFLSNLKKAQESGARVYTAQIPQYDISSTSIRNAILNKEDILQYVPDTVEKYIKENNLYIPREMSYEEIRDDLQHFLSKERFLHSDGVATECVRLAEIFGADVEKCRMAGILHDCAKELTQKQYYWMGLNVDFDDDFEGKQVLLHAEAGAILAKERYGICDEEILEAIQCHITGKPCMGIIAQLLFVADYTEVGRVGETFDAVRKHINKGNLFEAMLQECDSTLIYNLDKENCQICTQTIKTRNWIVKKIKENIKDDSRREQDNIK